MTKRERPTGSSFTRRLGGLVVRLYPAEVAEAHGHELVEAWLSLVRTAARRGLGPAGIAWFGGLGNLLWGAVQEWRRPGRDPSMSATTGGGMMGGVGRDLKLAVRGLARQPLFALVAAGSIAIGIGANTAVFGVANGLLIQPLPGIPAYERVVELGRSREGRGFDTFSYPDFADLDAEVPALASAAAYSIEIFSVSQGEGEEGIRTNGLLTSAAYFDVLGALPSSGRFFLPSEDEGLGEHPVVVLSHHFWQRHLGADPSVVGTTILVNRVPFEVVGITEERFRGHLVGLTPDVFIPLSQSVALNPSRAIMFDRRGASWLLVIGQMAPEVEREALDAQLAGFGARLAEAFPDTNTDRTFSAMPLGPIPGAGRGGVRLFLLALLGMVGLIVLVTCTNVAGMFLARATARGREFAVRRSLGAGRGAIVQQLTIETLLVFVVGGGVGLLLGGWVLGFARPDLIPAPIPLSFDFQVDRTVTVAGLVTTLVTGLVFGLMPAARASRVPLAAAMREGGRGASGGVGRLRLALAASQVGFSLVLLATAALFVRSLQRANEVDTGFDPDGAYVTLIDLALEGFDDADGPAVQADLWARLSEQDWVEAASLSSDLPLDLGSSGTTVRPEGWDTDPEADLLPIGFNRVSPDYFEALGIPILAGRPLDASDRAGTARVAVVSRYFADQAWPAEDPVGRSFRLGRALDVDSLRYEVVGVSADVKNQVITEADRAFAYFPLTQRYSASTQVTVRTRLPRSEALELFRGTLVSADPTMSRGPIVPLREYTSVGTLPQRIAASLTTALAVVALLLAALGIYGVVAFTVSSRRREIGIRMALGADAGGVVRRLVRGGLLLALPGLLLGVGASVGVGQMVQVLLLDLSPLDPLALGGGVALLLTVVVLASWIPARRAARVDPAESLRQE